jgi:hypothetical protein
VTTLAAKMDYGAIANQIVELQVHVRDKIPNVLGALKKESADATIYYQIFDTASIALYTLGVIVTVIGQVIGNEGKRSIN